MTKPIDRHNPLSRSSYLSYQHIARYLFVLDKLPRGSRVLDIACGTGYGTVLLHRAGHDVIGADIDQQEIEDATKYWQLDAFREADALQLPFPDNHFDAVVSFETIEHVTDAAKYLSEMKRVLKDSGMFFCSTPNIRFTRHPAFHLKEYEPDEYFSLIDQNFEQAERYCQYFSPKDWYSDLFDWKIKGGIVRFAKALGLKVVLQRIKLLRDNPKPYDTGADTSSPKHRPAIDIELNIPQEYAVQKCESADRLRIMVTLSRK